MLQRALAIALLLLAFGAAASTAFAGAAPACCATNTGAPIDAGCGGRAVTEPASDTCCELLPAEAAPERSASFDSSRLAGGGAVLVSAVAPAHTYSLRPALQSRTRALQPEPDPTIVLRI